MLGLVLMELLIADHLVLGAGFEIKLLDLENSFIWFRFLKQMGWFLNQFIKLTLKDLQCRIDSENHTDLLGEKLSIAALAV